MVDNKSLDVPIRIIAALLRDIQTSHGEVLTPRATRLTIQKIESRVAREGISFLTKTLPRLGKALDKALSGEASLDATSIYFSKYNANSQLPKFLGELFRCIFSHDGRVLPNPCVKCIKDIRQIAYLFYKYELPYDRVQEQRVLAKFTQTEQDLRLHSWDLEYLEERLLRNHMDALHTDSNNTTSPKRACWVSESDYGRRNCVPSSKHHACYQGAVSTQIVSPTFEWYDDCVDCSSKMPGRIDDATERQRSTSALGASQVACMCRERAPRKGAGSLRRNGICSGKCRLKSFHLAEQLTFQPWLSEFWNGQQLSSPTSLVRKQDQVVIAARARKLLSRLFSTFDSKDIYPRHGPGAVSTGERLWTKYHWSKISPRIIESYPLDAFFFASLGHVCDKFKEFNSIELGESPARVLLVPKDSRGPRLISCEPLDFQWIQQGLGSAIVRHVEHNTLTKYNVHFTDQRPNQIGALLGSETTRYATLDLNEASDRISVDLVRLLFPDPLLTDLLNCRSLGTVLPSGEYLKLKKFAPMGSALCFPVLALTVWALLTAGMPDADTREGILVYGDDVVVPTAQAENAMNILESFGLKINRDKSCYRGFFRESCGVDAFKGVDVTPIRIRTVWSSSRCPSAYTSWIAYANSLRIRGYYNTYDSIVEILTPLYGEIPESDNPESLGYPALLSVPEAHRPKKFRTNTLYQKVECKVWTIKSLKTQRTIDGWSMLLRYFAESVQRPSFSFENDCVPRRCGVEDWLDLNWVKPPFSASSYTKRGSSILVQRWR